MPLARSAVDVQSHPARVGTCRVRNPIPSDDVTSKSMRVRFSCPTGATAEGADLLLVWIAVGVLRVRGARRSAAGATLTIFAALTALFVGITVGLLRVRGTRRSAVLPALAALTAGTAGATFVLVAIRTVRLIQQEVDVVKIPNRNAQSRDVDLYVAVAGEVYHAAHPERGTAVVGQDGLEGPAVAGRSPTAGLHDELIDAEEPVADTPTVDKGG